MHQPYILFSCASNAMIYFFIAKKCISERQINICIKSLSMCIFSTKMCSALQNDQSAECMRTTINSKGHIVVTKVGTVMYPIVNWNLWSDFKFHSIKWSHWVSVSWTTYYLRGNKFFTAWLFFKPYNETPWIWLIKEPSVDCLVGVPGAFAIILGFWHA